MIVIYWFASSIDAQSTWGLFFFVVLVAYINQEKALY